DKGAYGADVGGLQAHHECQQHDRLPPRFACQGTDPRFGSVVALATPPPRSVAITIARETRTGASLLSESRPHWRTFSHGWAAGRILVAAHAPTPGVCTRCASHGNALANALAANCQVW